MTRPEKSEGRTSFFRRMSLAADSRPTSGIATSNVAESVYDHRAPSVPTVARPGRVLPLFPSGHDRIRGPSYGALPSGAAPSALAPSPNASDRAFVPTRDQRFPNAPDPHRAAIRSLPLHAKPIPRGEPASTTGPSREALESHNSRISHAGQSFVLGQHSTRLRVPGPSSMRSGGTAGRRVASSPVASSTFEQGVPAQNPLPRRTSSGMPSAFTALPTLGMSAPVESPRLPSAGKAPLHVDNPPLPAAEPHMAGRSSMFNGDSPQHVEGLSRVHVKHGPVSSRKVISTGKRQPSGVQQPDGRAHLAAPFESEASAYAKAITHTLSTSVMTDADVAVAEPSPLSSRHLEAVTRRDLPLEYKAQRRVSRPLPRPPSGSLSRVSTDGASTSTGLLKETGAALSGRSFIAESTMPRVSPNQVNMKVLGAHRPGDLDTSLQSVESRRPSRSHEPAPVFIDFPRSPTLPPLIDPRTKEDRAGQPSAIELWVRGVQPRSPEQNAAAPTLGPAQLPLQQSHSTAPAGARTDASCGITDPVSPGSLNPASTLQHTVSALDTLLPRPDALDHKRKAGLRVLLSIPRIQSAILANLSINAFLSLTGVSDSLRSLFSGETVGRWIMEEWGIQVERESGRSWPNLTVWEGFLESLLHDPATYSTYPAQWHNLLQHLSLSHTLIVLHLRSLPEALFPNPAPLPFEDDVGGIGHGASFTSYSSLPSQLRPSSRVGSVAGSDTGSIIGLAGKMPKQERVVEIVMPTPLSGEKDPVQPTGKPITLDGKLRRRDSASAMTTASVPSFGRRRTNSMISASDASIKGLAVPVPQGKIAPPPVSFPTAKRYGFRRPSEGQSNRSRRSSESGRPGSVYSAQSSPALSGRPRMGSVHGSHMLAIASASNMVGPLSAPGSKHTSMVGSEAGHSSRRSEVGRYSPNVAGHGTLASTSRRNGRPEPMFDRPPPYVLGRAPILRVFVPLSAKIPQWPSADAAKLAVRELDKCGASRRMKLGDLVINTAIRQPKSTEHVLLFVPYIKHLLVPLEYRFSATGHLPAYVDAFAIPPSYYYPFLPPPQIVYLNLAVFCARAYQSIRLAFDRRDVTVTSGQRVVAKRFLHVAGFEITAHDKVASEWLGMVSLEAEGTAEGKSVLEHRLGYGNPTECVTGPWEVVRDKSMAGNIWLRLVKLP